ncbi:MAG: bifunctional histidinol-phosphatase/imidazoleglycerol-phosphate dehydratase HisB [Bacteroidales bacterium]|nr:bifunctional histidinol-phosphatase/imidazoleglycerol-phosphate dehydratase HisB [Bacteroidales bacterium]
MSTLKRVLFVDRDGTLIVEPQPTLQVDTLEQLELLPGVVRNLYFLRQHLDFELVMVSNQDALGTEAYPQAHFDVVQDKLLTLLGNEGITFDAIYIDKSREEDHAPTRKPGTAMLTAYMDGSYDLAGSFVIGDRATDVRLAQNLGCRAILINSDKALLSQHHLSLPEGSVQVDSWDQACEWLFAGERRASVHRVSKETDVFVELDLDGQPVRLGPDASETAAGTHIDTGLKFFDHMLEQIGRHSGMSLTIVTRGDLQVDEHHTIEDTAIALGEALRSALGSKRGIERYGFCLPMDDSLCSLALDFGGRPWLVWDVKFQREYVGDVPTEMFLHFFKSLSDAARMNLNIKAEGDNDHHRAEAIFKALARALKMAVRRDIYHYELPSTKGML